MSLVVQPGNVSSSLDHNIGFHFTYSSKLAYHRPPQCSELVVDYLLPRGLFADPYELDLRSDSYSYATDIMPDLERPVSAVAEGDTALRLRLNPSSISDSGLVEISLPLHARYGDISESAREEAYAKLFLPFPQAFWHCPNQGVSYVAVHLQVLTCPS